MIEIDSYTSARDQRGLINTALVRMRDDGTILALKLRTGDVAATTMLMTGFLPRPTDSYQMIHWLTQLDSNTTQGQQQFLWR